MTARRAVGVAAGVATFLLGAASARAHRVDEYLQATTILVGKDRVHVQIRLTPGVAVFASVFADIDANADRVLSDVEQRAYAERVLRDLSLTIDGAPVRLRLLASTFALADIMREGLGDIVLDVDATVPNGGGARRLTFANAHRRRIGVYLVNALVPRDPDVRVTAQSRSVEQSFYRLDYEQTRDGEGPWLPGWWTGSRAWFGLAMLSALAPLALLTRRGARLVSANPPFTTRS